MKKTFIPALALMLLVSGTTLADPTASPNPAGGPLSDATLSALNLDAVNFMHYANQLEIRGAKSALANLKNPQAISLAKMMVQDHQANDREVLRLAGRKGWKLYPFSKSPFDTADGASLSALKGKSDYDRAFQDSERFGHTSVLSRLRLYQATLTDQDLLALIEQTIPAIEKHLALAGGAIPGAPPKLASAH
jgi:predicted outer membrane protein